MVVYWFMLIWVFVIGYSQPDETNPIKSNSAKEYRATWGMAFGLLFPVIFFSAARGYIMDTSAYVDMFIKMPSDILMFDEYMKTQIGSQLFYGCQMLFKCYISDDPFMWTGLISIIQGLCMVKFFQRYSPNIAMSIYIFVASTQFTWMNNGIRQFMAVAILMTATEWIIQKKWYFYLPLTILVGGCQKFFEWFGWGDTPWFLGGIHQSALLMLPLYFLLRGKPWNKLLVLFVAVFMVFAVTGNIEPLIGDMAQETEYAGDFKDMDDYAAQGIIEDDGAHPIRAVVPLVPVVMAFYRRKEIEAMGDEVPPIINLSINAAVVTEVMYIASVITSGIMIGRLPIYTELYTFVLLPWLILHPYKNSSKLLTLCVYGAYLMWFLYQMYVAWGGLGYETWVPLLKLILM